MPVPADKYDEIRRKRIARYKSIFAFQNKRAQALARQIRDRDTERSGARVDPADDDVMDPFIARKNSVFDSIIVGTPAVLAPIGWPAGYLIYKVIVELIPAQLRSYPIALLAWAAVGVGLPIPLLYDPNATVIPVNSGNWLLSVMVHALNAVLLPWLLAQVPAALASAAVYGVLEGWLAIPGARDWLPGKAPTQHVEDNIDYGFGPDDLTRPSIFPRHHEAPPGDPVPPQIER
jgi:hypothetical protein